MALNAQCDGNLIEEFVYKQQNARISRKVGASLRFASSLLQ